MVSPLARIATGLDKDTYFFVLRNYTELREQYNEERECFSKLKFAESHVSVE